jgi:hypothetical protein
MTKRNSITVPDGYFQNLEQRLQQIPQREMQSAAPRGVARLAPYVAYAASLVLLVTIGTFILRPSAKTEDEAWDYVSYLALSLDPDGLVELKETEELTDDDIRSYLLASNITVEQLALLSDEEAY